MTEHHEIVILQMVGIILLAVNLAGQALLAWLYFHRPPPREVRHCPPEVRRDDG